MPSPSSTSTAAADSLIPGSHPFAQHLLHAAALDARSPHRPWAPQDGPLPTLFISHGAPNLFVTPPWMNDLLTWARALPRPRAVLIVSAHWESAPLSISSPQPRELVYDFGGFEALYYSLRYDTPPADDFARQVASLMPDSEPVHVDNSRGLDHGAWVPLKIMYPEADIPVLQMSLPTHNPEKLMDLGRRLKTLRETGVLVIGSGFMTHGLPFIDWQNPHVPPGWSVDFDQWAADALARGDVDELTSFRSKAPGLPFAHPTVEHFTPLFVTLGAANDPTQAPTTTIDGYATGMAKRSFQMA
ncbi:dioxygenase family protein [Streptomyces sp. NPDC003509]